MELPCADAVARGTVWDWSRARGRREGALGVGAPPHFQPALICPRSPPGPPPTASPLAHAPASWSWGRREGQTWTCPEPRPLPIQPSLLPPPSLASGPQLGQFLSLDLEMLLFREQKCLPRARASSRGRPEPAPGARLGAARRRGPVSQAPPLGCASHCRPQGAVCTPR